MRATERALPNTEGSTGIALSGVLMLKHQHALQHLRQMGTVPAPPEAAAAAFALLETVVSAVLSHGAGPSAQSISAS